MTPDAGPPDELVVKAQPGRWKAVLLLLVVLTFTAMGIVLIVKEGTLLAWGVTAFFAIGIPVAVMELLPTSSCLRLTRKGFTVRTRFRTWSRLWQDVYAFRVVKMSTGGVPTAQFIMFDYAPSYQVSRATQTLAAVMGVGQGNIPGDYEMPAEQLAALMNDFRERFAGDSAQARANH
jgi:hypothetical protein